MVIIWGLGNIGAKYDNTYHNLGFMAVDKLAEILGLKFSKEKNKAIFCEGVLNNKKVILAKPTTYMNNSGEAVALFKRKFKDARIIVLVDDIDLPAGKVRYREKGSAGTHNGLRSIVSYIGEDFERIRIGTGREEKIELVDFVLSKIKDKELFDRAISETCKLVTEKI